jgi:hypothetical protein
MAQSRNSTRCAVCWDIEHKHEAEVLLARGASVKSVARKFGWHYRALLRHWNGHVSASRKAYLMMGHAPSEKLRERIADENASALSHYAYARSVIYEMLEAAREAGDRNGVGVLVGRLHENLSALARITGELAQSPLVQINNHNEQNIAIVTQQVSFLQAALLRALARHPAARDDVLAIFQRFDKTIDLQPEPADGTSEIRRTA